MNATLATLAFVAGLAIIARLLIVHANRREESLAERRIRALLADDEIEGEELNIEPAPRRRLFGRDRSQHPKPVTVTRVADWLQRSRIFRDPEGKSFIEKVRTESILAGLEHRYTPYELLAVGIVIWTVGVFGTTLVYLAGAVPKGLYIASVLIAAYYPFSKLKSLKQRRADAISAEIIMFIMQLRMALSANATLEDALTRVARQAELDPYDSVLADEFGRAVNRVRVSNASFSESLREVSERTQVLAVENLVEAIVQGHETGADLTVILEEYGKSAAELWQQDMRTIKARKEPMVTIGLMITLFGAFLLIAGPMMISLMRTMSFVGGGG